ncbi:Crp/Fnr family transcriptional regulator [Streptomyces sp. H39-S7]|uniref:Crp/Fnr family transcriptional regulator n=1 Tax=Streptomyces sp. H39-S7 TaxID=3004357 RepID=UPI0022AEB324|nr:Crp/Fnr family transcriptional regulator [Streptomyces sp. H39-S7]MCZ4120786.1 Crp/Fnr family transcriptional regulator [Streptomyces sp. H39-S7]
MNPDNEHESLNERRPERETFWSLLDGTARERLVSAGHVHTYSARSHLLRQDEFSDHVLVLRTGCVKVYAESGTGYQVVLALRNGGDLLGEQAGLDRQPRSASIYALTDTEALVVPASRFAALLWSQPTMGAAVQQVLSRRLREADRHRAAIGSVPVEARLAALVLDLGERYGRRTTDGSLRIDLPLSQDDLAGLVVSSRRTISRILEEWRREKLLTTGRQALELAGLHALRHRAEDPGAVPGWIAPRGEGHAPGRSAGQEPHTLSHE